MIETDLQYEDRDIKEFRKTIALLDKSLRKRSLSYRVRKHIYDNSPLYGCMALCGLVNVVFPYICIVCLGM